MGACEFTTRARGKTAQDAFAAAVGQAQYEDGHGGYSGTIAEKSSFVMIVPLAGESPMDCANRLLEADDHRIADKWGPAGCIDCGISSNPDTVTRVFLFFGWASE